MWLRLMLLSWLVAGTQASYSSPIRWGGTSSSKFVLAPRLLPSRSSVLGKAGTQFQTLMILEEPVMGSSDETPYFMANADNTITWDGTSLCIEARGSRRGDPVGVNHCTATSTQLWDILPRGNGHKKENLIQLRGTTKCIDVNKDAGFHGALAELQECDRKSSKPWIFDEPIALPAQHFSQRSTASLAARHLAVCFTSMVLLGVLSFRVWSLQWRTNLCKRGMTSSEDQGGISLIVPTALHHDSVPFIHSKAAQDIVPAAMAIDPLKGNEDTKGTLGGAVLGGLLAGPFGALWGSQLGGWMGANARVSREEKEKLERMGLSEDVLQLARATAQDLAEAESSLKLVQQAEQSQASLVQRLDGTMKDLYAAAEKALTDGDEAGARDCLEQKNRVKAKHAEAEVELSAASRRLAIMKANVADLATRAAGIEQNISRTVASQPLGSSNDIVGESLALDLEDPLLRKFRDLEGK